MSNGIVEQREGGHIGIVKNVTEQAIWYRRRTKTAPYFGYSGGRGRLLAQMSGGFGVRDTSETKLGVIDVGEVPQEEEQETGPNEDVEDTIPDHLG